MQTCQTGGSTNTVTGTRKVKKEFVILNVQKQKRKGSRFDAKRTYHNLNHHTAISTRKTASSETVNKLRHHRAVFRSVRIQGYVRMELRSEVIVFPNGRTHETKNIDTPIPPNPAKTPVAGKIIIPSVTTIS